MIDQCNVDVIDYINTLPSYHQLSLDQVRALSGWFLGNKISALTNPTNMKLNAINPNEAGNLGLVNQYNICLQQLCGSLHFILKNQVSITSYNPFHPKKSKLIYTDDFSGRQITCGLILFMMVLEVMKPQLVIDHGAKERKMEDPTIDLCENNVCTYLTKMQDMQNEIYSLQKDGIKYNEQWFLTPTFDELKKNAGDLIADVKPQRSYWLKKPSAFNTSNFITDMINLYSSYKSTSKWDKKGANQNKVLVALDTSIKQKRDTKKKSPGKPTSSMNKTTATEPENSTGPPEWEFKNIGKTTMCSDTGAK